MPAIQSPFRLLFWCKNNPLHERKSSGYNKNMNKRAGFKNKNAKYPAHDQQSSYNKEGKFHVAFFNLGCMLVKTCPLCKMDGVTAYLHFH